jgi:trehalose synthase
LHVNSTKFGGGVAEILQNMIPLMSELNLDACWKNFEAPNQFFDITKRIHNALQGDMESSISNEEFGLYLKQGERIFYQLHPYFQQSDLIIMHDPQTCPVIEFVDKYNSKWIWRCHIDTSTPNPEAWNILKRFIPKYDWLIFHRDEFVSPNTHPNIYTMPPSIDPFSVKNLFLEESITRAIAEKFVPLDLPLITQVSRFDPWKDPLGVIKAFKKIRMKVPCRLVLIGSLARDDPEGIRLLESVRKQSEDDQYIHILTNLDGVSDLEVNAFQRLSKVIIQKSLREGFGLTVTEAMWKETPVVAGNVGGIRLQIENGFNGVLVNSIDETVEKTIYLLKNPREARIIGKMGKETVKKEFLLTKHIERYLDFFMKISD